MTTPTPSSAAPLEVTDENAEKPSTSDGPKDTATRSPGQLAWLRFKRDRTGVVSAIIVICFFVLGLCAPLIAKIYGKDPYTNYGVDDPSLLGDNGLPAKPNGGISSDFWFGIDPQLGRDVFTFLWYSIRNSLLLATGITVLAMIVGVVIGVTAGYVGGKTDWLLGRVMDILLAFPQQLFFVAFTPVVLALFVGDNENTPTSLIVASLILLLVVFGWASVARLLRGQVLALREREYVEAAKVTGASPARIIFKELLPNLWTPILIQGTLMLPMMVSTEAGLAYLGVGLQDPTPDWGVMIGYAAQWYQDDITLLMFPGLAMVIFVLAFNLLGDSVRDALDPKTKR
ncbi:ABC transporter permease [Streptomyces sp. RY43-2]|uniref:ABC transporter permease n=1 Tax=Streptomyces macrolidinus TaxID=2952607 RepID=A0ABT0ZHD6_9ACTN|nr:ABC transporter permease [Streptomyces macrolidinus]MCN9243004.1 ABC transporter permease [Streptomyces macrolidinus]